MPSLNFPDSPSLNDVYVFGERAWQWNGKGWGAYPSPLPGIYDLTVDGNIDVSGDLNTSGNVGVSGDLNTDGNLNSEGDVTIVGDISLLDGSPFTTTIQTITPTANRVISYPDATGTLALIAGSSGQLLWNNAGANAGVTNSIVDSSGNITIGGRFISSVNAALSTTGITGVPTAVTGTWVTTGGTATTTKPQFLIEPTGTASTGWSTAGTGLGINAPSGFTGNLLDLQVNGTRMIRADAFGGLYANKSAINGGTAAGYLFANTSEGILGFRCDADNNIGVFTRSSQTYCSFMFGSPFRPVFKLGASFAISWGANDFVGFTDDDLFVRRDAAGILAQRNGTNAQTFRVYNTFTSDTNHERGYLSWSSNVFRIGTEKGSGGGTARAMELQTDGTTRVQITRDGVYRYSQATPAAVNTTAVLTIANLQAGLITTTTTAAVDMTLPTGTDTESGFAVNSNDLTFEWSVINTGSNPATIIANTDHTIVGAAAVVAGTSGRFATRRTATNTYITYRIS